MQEQQTQRPLSMVSIIRQFAHARNVRVEDLTSPCRKKGLVELRRDLIRELSTQGFGVTAIARRMDRDHATICHHLRYMRANGEMPAPTGPA